MKSFATLLTGVMLLFMVAQVKATVLTFDNVTPLFVAEIPDGYGGFNWDNFFVIKGTIFPGTGYANGTVSGDYTAYNYGGVLASLSGGSFNFNGAYLTAAWRDGLNINIKGYNGNAEIYNRTVTADTTGPMWFDFNYPGVNRLEFESYGGVPIGSPTTYQFVMDNFTFNEPVPEPSTLLLLGSGLAALAGLRKVLGA